MRTFALDFVCVAFGAGNAQIFVTAEIDVIVGRNVAVNSIDIDVEIVIGIAGGSW